MKNYCFEFDRFSFAIPLTIMALKYTYIYIYAITLRNAISHKLTKMQTKVKRRPAIWDSTQYTWRCFS